MAAITTSLLTILSSGDHLLAQEAVREKLIATCGEKPWHVEGIDHAQWVLLDYGPFVVHVFHDETRAYYDLERLWSDCPRVEWKPV